MNNKTKKILFAMFIVIVIIRLVLAFYVPNFTYDSYFHLRQVEQITKTGLPLYQDNLSYGGREHLFLPFFHYFMAFFNLFLPLSIVAKIIPNLLIASIIPITYLISYKITNNNHASLLSALIAGFLPILFTTNSFIVDTLFIPVTFISIYAFINVRTEIQPTSSKKLTENVQQQKFLYLYIFSFLILSITSTLTFLLLIGFGIYILLSLIEGKKINNRELEIITFSIFFFLWVQFLFFKNSLLQEGISFVWQNIPLEVMNYYFPKLSIIQALLLGGIIPFLAGIFVVYRSLFQLKNQKAFLLISFVISTTILAWLRIIQFKQSLTFFSIILAILFASFYSDIEKYLKKTKVSHLNKYFLSIIIILLLISTAFPAINISLQQSTPSNEEIEAFTWIQNNTEPDSTVLATLEEGHLITFYSKRKNMIDDQFDLIKDIDKRFNDLNSLFNTRFETRTLGITKEYNLQYFVLTPSAKEQYNLKEEFSYGTKRCFQSIYNNETKIYLVRCEVQ